MANTDYEKALRLGQKEYRSRLTNGEYPYLPVLDDLLSHTDIETRTDLGLIDIPLELIVGTSTQGRTTAFAGNFMPLLEDTTEFALKWTHLYDSMLDIGQRDPVKAYEFMNRFYIVEGNKRVSVSKYLNGVSVYGTVTRYVPKYDPNDLDIVLYYEFLDFYKVAGINYIEFSKEGSFKKLMEIVAGSTDHVWTSDEKPFSAQPISIFPRSTMPKAAKSSPLQRQTPCSLIFPSMDTNNFWIHRRLSCAQTLQKYGMSFSCIRRKNRLPLSCSQTTRHRGRRFYQS